MSLATLPAIASALASPPGADAAWRAIAAASRARYRRAGRYAWHFAAGKLRGDRIFRRVLERGLVAPGARVLDLGCGQGLLASVLAAAGAAARDGRWPKAWAPAPVGAQYAGIECAARDVERARSALEGVASFACADLREAALAGADTIVLFDVLHYLDRAAQDALLERARSALSPGGTLLLRVGDAASGRRHMLSRWTDRVVVMLRGASHGALTSRPLQDWIDRLEGAGLVVDAEPMNGAFYANTLLVGRSSDRRTTSDRRSTPDRRAP